MHPLQKLAPTALDPWNRVATKLRSAVHDPRFAEALAELSEWFWNGCLEECSEEVGAALLQSPLARENFDALAMLDTAGYAGRRASTELLTSGKCSAAEASLLAEAIAARPRLFRVGRGASTGRRRLHEVRGGSRRSVALDGWPVRLRGGDLAVGRVIGSSDQTRWIGPVYPFPAGTPADVILDVRQGLNDLDQASPQDRGAATERFLVDLHHQWFFHVFVPRQRPTLSVDPPPVFSLLPGSVRTSG